jgi:methyltransferase (TIGR00027 family)
MQEFSPSRTALRVALRRSAHQLFDNPKILDDPLAVPIVGEHIAEIRNHPKIFESRIGKSIRAFMVVRSRYAEDQLAAAVASGIRQYVVLGAGLDTSAYRAPTANSQLAVFEVDHPATQGWKRQRLSAANIAIPPNLQYVSVDFEKQRLPEELARAGFRTSEPAFVSWLGVVPYLTREAAAATFGYLGKLPPGSGVVFDYGVARSALTFFERMALDAIARRVEKAGEPFKLLFEPQELNDFISALGFHRIEQLNATELNARYFANRADGLRVAGGVGRVVGAWV